MLRLARALRLARMLDEKDSGLARASRLARTPGPARAPAMARESGLVRESGLARESGLETNFLWLLPHNSAGDFNPTEISKSRALIWPACARNSQSIANGTTGAQNAHRLDMWEGRGSIEGTTMKIYQAHNICTQTIAPKTILLELGAC